ncbi:hypothetical protein DDV96_12885 [Marixanthomonas spongiae]|uniref:Uncharacterized protein n=1 Tax=Marixanthomonas spongiae TaxID=2174845 RepID=A0A2U0HXH7_9FLAO|nr:hypothetical protein DDV96_12885 [Marixanthomonas spongiae]
MFLGAVEFSFYFPGAPTFIKTEFGHFYRDILKMPFGAFQWMPRTCCIAGAMRSFSWVFVGAVPFGVSGAGQ